MDQNSIKYTVIMFRRIRTQSNTLLLCSGGSEHNQIHCYNVQEDQNTIKSLKKEIEKAWKMVDTAQEGEERARETIETLNTEIQNLTKVRVKEGGRARETTETLNAEIQNRI